MKITKSKTAAHDRAMSLINSSRPLNDDEIEFCFENYNPMADHNVGKGGIFFTPPGLARDLAVMARCDDTVVDLCAGIGILSYYMGLYNPPKRIVAVEINQEFVRIGKRLLPYVEWHHADVLDYKYMASLGEFTVAISNPPYGNIPGYNVGWTRSTGPMQWRVLEVAVRLAHSATFILPSTMGDHDHRRGFEQRKYPEKTTYFRKFPGIVIADTAVDCDLYEDDWEGARPQVRLYDIDDDSAIGWHMPFGFGDLFEQLVLGQVA